ncbi:MAG: OmpA family protein [Chlorobi bacterium]|nr:OmpA family protein [Chlorobiota bacterium]
MRSSSFALRTISLLATAVTALTLVGCPQTLVKRIEQLRPPPNYRPVLADTTTEISADTLLLHAARGWDPLPDTHPDTSSAGDTIASAPTSGCIVELHPRQLDDGRYPSEIVFDVIVTDRNGRLVTGLAPPTYRGDVPWRNLWFWLSDSCKGTVAMLDSFSVEELRAMRNERFAVAFVLDHSPSMGQARVILLRRAIEGVLREFIPGDAAMVISFGGRSTVEIPITADSSVYRRFDPRAGRMIGGTAIYDAVTAAVSELRKVPQQYRRVIVLLTDGEDNASKSTLQQAVRAALDSAVTIYTIAYGWFDEEPLRLLAQGTHGQMYRIYSVREFPHIFARIYRALRSFYRVRYRPPECAGIHTVQVGLRLAGCSAFVRAVYDRSVLTALDTVGTMVFLPIEFDFDRATIRPESLPLLERIADAMKVHPSLRLEVRGHTDDRGSDEYNMRLSQRRAEAVVDALVDMGVDRSRLRAVGFGKMRPLVENTSDENRARNRRTEFVIIKN